MKILVVDLDTEWRGGQNQALLMLEGFQARNHHTELVSPDGSALGDRAQARGIRVHRVSPHLSRISAAARIRRAVAGFSTFLRPRAILITHSPTLFM